LSLWRNVSKSWKTYSKAKPVTSSLVAASDGPVSDLWGPSQRTFVMIAQTTVRHNVPVAKQPVQRVRRWVKDHYEWVTLTREQVESDKRRAAFVEMFDPCNVGG
jgi:hypothetical protein